MTLRKLGESMEPKYAFRGRNMTEAVAQLKQALGADAVIHNTRRGRDGQGRFVEITASGQQQVALRSAAGGQRAASAAYARSAALRSVEPAAPPSELASAARALASEGGEQRPFAKRAVWLAKEVARQRETTEAPEPIAPPAAAPSDAHAVREELAALRAAIHQMHRPEPASEAAPSLDAVVAELQRELSELKTAVRVGGTVPDQLTTPDRLEEVLLELGLGAELTAELRRTMGPERTFEGLAESLAGMLPVADGLLPAVDERRVLAFVGPTGVGKTTTIAKVAARAQLLEGIPTALVTVDTFRMAAVEQLARYAQILECPLHVVKQPEDLPKVLEALGDTRLVLIDTTGRNPRAQDQVKALERFFPKGWAGQSVLTVAASTRERDLKVSIEAFARLEYDYVCVTKMDETDAVGTPFAVARQANRPLAWLTCGQRVPEDIERPRPRTLAARVVKQALAGLARR